MALSALANFDTPSVLHTLARAASDPDEQIGTAAIGFLAGRAEHEATATLVHLLGAPATSERALAGLLVPAQGRVPGLLVALESAGDELAPILTSVLAKLPGSGAATALKQALQLANVAARKAAASALAARGSAEATAALRRAADTDPDPSVRQICALLLAQ